MTDVTNTDLSPLELAAELTGAWLANPNTRASADDVPAFLSRMVDAINVLNASPADETTGVAPAEYAPAVTARKSLANPDFIISMLDGKPYKTLRRHLSTNGLTPAEYRERFKLKTDYPMVAANYSEARRAMAKSIGLGRKAGTKVEPKTDKPARKPRSAKASEAE
ncbi:MAG: transcriptional regulator [Oxalobacteraceae bacterium]|nr:MAG: transcriptional regulator [Oxalobacteraceae bacterium]